MDWRVRAGVLAAAYVGAVLALTTLAGLPAFAMSFASSSILLAAQPDSAAARPRSLIGGHLLAAICGWVVGALAGDAVWAAALAIGVAALLMQVTDTLHPPAAVSGYLMFQQHSHWTWLLFPVFTGAALLAGLAWVAARLWPPRMARVDA